MNEADTDIDLRIAEDAVEAHWGTPDIGARCPRHESGLWVPATVPAGYTRSLYCLSCSEEVDRLVERIDESTPSERGRVPAVEDAMRNHEVPRTHRISLSDFSAYAPFSAHMEDFDDAPTLTPLTPLPPRVPSARILLQWEEDARALRRLVHDRRERASRFEVMSSAARLFVSALVGR